MTERQYIRSYNSYLRRYKQLEEKGLGVTEKHDYEEYKVAYDSIRELGTDSEKKNIPRIIAQSNLFFSNTTAQQLSRDMKQNENLLKEERKTYTQIRHMTGIELIEFVKTHMPEYTVKSPAQASYLYTMYYSGRKNADNYYGY